ncbi:ABC transporter ATP-binding protein [Candidatus Dojkabacteria bacterium]|uniref:ABC transporter ATP-binding protein n=1 Tax=Candidatus Dojkabacteria bacterium TaxID=2099670 RepID=A0A3M0Z1U5_9BACT|nr:MAG: ABC transporter ATP-binding protein [Candidatus Dojkabacteria bacterium]
MNSLISDDTNKHSNEFVIEVKNLYKTYKLGTETITALNGVSLGIVPGEMVAITGPSGSGKSTLMHIIGGLDRPTSGDVLVLGKNISRLNQRQLAQYRNTTIGFVFQSFYLQPTLSAIDNVKLPLVFTKKNVDRTAVAKDVLGKLGLLDRLKNKPSELSGGQRQRVAIARAIVNNPKVILADEPTGNLDSKTGKGVIELLRNLNKTEGVTIIIVTHDMSVAELCDRTIKMRDGQIIND